MIQDDMIKEVQELKLAGYTPGEVHAELKSRHTKVPTLKTVRKYYNMDCVPDDNHAKVRKQMAFDCEPFASAIVEIVELNPDCYMSSVYDVLVKKFVENGDYEALPGNEQTLRNYIHRLEEDGKIGQAGKDRRKYDVVPTPPPGRKAQVDFGEQRCDGGLVVHFMCILLPSLYEAAPLFLQPVSVNGQPYVLHRAVKYSVPWEMCYTTAYKRVIGAKLHIYDDKRRYVCTHDVCDVKGAFIRLDEHRRQPASDWLDTAERMRRKWNCTEFQHFINGFKRENPDRHLGKQLAAVERYLDERGPDRALVADVMAACCRDYRYRYTQFKAVFDPSELESGITATQIERLKDLDWLDSHGNVVLAGPPGLGKTMIALGLGLLAIDSGYTVAFEKMESFIGVLDNAGVDRKAGFRLRYLRKCQLVIVDEIGYTPITKQQANRFFSFVSDAYERTSMVFTTNKEITQWEELMGDQALVTAMLDRILHHARCFSLRGESYRLKHPELYAAE